MEEEDWCRLLLIGVGRLTLDTDTGREEVMVSSDVVDALLLVEADDEVDLASPFQMGVSDLSSPLLKMTESVSVTQVLIPSFLEGETDPWRLIIVFLMVLREERSESLTEGTGEGAAGRPFCSRRRCKAA